MKQLFSQWKATAWLFLLTVAIFSSGTNVALGAESGSLTLEQAQIQAEAFSPQLQSFASLKQATMARRDQIGRRANPALELEAENLAGTGEYSGFGASEWTFFLAQKFDLAGHRSQAQNVVDQELNLQQVDRVQVLLDLQQEVGLAFAEVWLAQEEVALTRQKLELAHQLLEIIGTRQDTGGSSPRELTRARLGVATAEMEQVRAEETWRLASLSLANHWGETDPGFIEVQVAESFWITPAASGLSATVESNPDVARWTAVRRVQNALIEQVRKEKNINLELGLGLKFDNASGDKALVIGAGLPLPLPMISWKSSGRADAIPRRRVRSHSRPLPRPAKPTSAGFTARQMSLKHGTPFSSYITLTWRPDTGSSPPPF